MIEIIPAIDLIDGKCVRLSQGDFAQSKIYSIDPLETACSFEAAGSKRLHIVDLDGARTGRVTNLKVLESIARQTHLKIDFGGGIKATAQVASVFDAGAAMVSIGSVAAKSPELLGEWMQIFGADRIMLGADVRDGRVFVDGWKTRTDLEIVAYLSGHFAKGIDQTFVTDIAVDGMLSGPSIALYERLLTAVPGLKLIASGGVSHIDDIAELERVGCAGVIVGKAIYEGKIQLAELFARSPGSAEQK